MIAAFPSVGAPELLLLLAVLILLFGARKVPTLARAMGQALGELRRATDRDDDAPGPEAE